MYYGQINAFNCYSQCLPSHSYMYLKNILKRSSMAIPSVVSVIPADVLVMLQLLGEHRAGVGMWVTQEHPSIVTKSSTLAGRI